MARMDHKKNSTLNPYLPLLIKYANKKYIYIYIYIYIEREREREDEDTETRPWKVFVCSFPLL